jgi:glutamyl-tRNA reductase
VPALIGLGLTHRTAPLAVRERLAMPPAQASELMAALVATGAVDDTSNVNNSNDNDVHFDVIRLAARLI